VSLFTSTKAIYELPDGSSPSLLSIWSNPQLDLFIWVLIIVALKLLVPIWLWSHLLFTRHKLMKDQDTQAPMNSSFSSSSGVSQVSSGSGSIWFWKKCRWERTLTMPWSLQAQFYGKESGKDLILERKYFWPDGRLALFSLKLCNLVTQLLSLREHLGLIGSLEHDCIVIKNLFKRGSKIGIWTSSLWAKRKFLCMGSWWKDMVKTMRTIRKWCTVLHSMKICYAKFRLPLVQKGQIARQRLKKSVM